MLYFERMARTLFFIELAIFAALAIAFPSFAADATPAFVAPLAISLIAPLAAAMAVWPARSVAAALRSAFSPERPEPEEARLYSRILETLAAFSRLAAAMGLLFSLAAICGSARAAGRQGAWALVGLYMAAYAILNGMLWKLLAEVVARLTQAGTKASAPAAVPGTDGRDAGAAMAAKFGLTPRELETVLLIAGGMSYKEAAYNLGITLRTVKAHMGSVYGKTGAASNVALALLIRGEGPISTKVQ